MRGRAEVPRRGWLASIAALVLVVAFAGCGRRDYMGVLFPNQRPTVSITQSPPTRLDPSTYYCEISWDGRDSDGRVVGFRYAIDPPAAAGSDTAWVATVENRKVFTFASDSVAGGITPVAHRFHTFVVEAVDDRGSRSAPEHVSFDATTIAPVVVIESPLPSGLLFRRVAPAFRITWKGIDADGSGSRLPRQYRWKVFGSSTTPSLQAVLQNPDTLQILYAPTFASWDSLPGAATYLILHDLTPGQSYVFALVAIDEAGAWSAVLSPYENLLQFDVESAATSGPQITLATDQMTYQFPSGGIFLDTATWPRTDFGAGTPALIRWSAIVPSGASVRAARWAVDIDAIDDETPRSNQDTDIGHWSRWSSATTISISGLDPPPGQSSSSWTFYLEVEDDSDQLTLVGMQMSIIRPVFDRDLLIVDDTFLPPDRRNSTGDCVQLPGQQTWPMAAELDTFLYAVGGVPWRCYPTGTMSSPGLFAGYDFDTIGTHFLHDGAFNLSVLSRYRHVLWIVDGESATSFNQFFNTTIQPMPLLRHLSEPGIQNPLVTWMQQGGRLWLMGGGASYATLTDYSVTGDLLNVFRNSNGELVPGRFMYSYTHWQSEVTTYRSYQARRAARAVGGWPGAPDYSLLPPVLQQKTPATDPLPPLRNSAQFYTTLFYSEYLSKPNTILEHLPGLSGDSLAPALDTLYETVGGQSGTGYPVMTVYHGVGNSQVVFSGFPLWYFQRAQAIQVADFVFQRLWGLTRRPVAR
jgi:hypothetical protein